MTKKYIIGTRGSELALYQANLVLNELKEKHSDKDFEIKIITTKGDKVLDVALSKIGDKGLFTKELEDQLVSEEIDMAVHSLKDLPTVFPEGMALGAILKRAEYRDAFVSKNNITIESLTPEHKIATSSLRRKSQLLKINKNLNIIDIRGNVNTRLRKMDEGYCDAMIMAAAGLIRIGFSNRITQLIDVETIIPAPGQGAIAIEIKDGNTDILEIVKTLNHNETQSVVTAERAFLQYLEGGCQVPIGSFAKIKDNKLHIEGIISSIDGKTFVKGNITGDINNAYKIGVDLAKDLYKKGGKEILSTIRI